MNENIAAFPEASIDKVISAYLDVVCAEFAGVYHCPFGACINLVSCFDNSAVDDGGGMDYDVAVVFGDRASPDSSTVVDN